MVSIFYKIRKQLAVRNRPVQYMRYAIGEIILVMIGILLALQVNNWNELRKRDLVKRDYFENLLTSLQQDSLELIRILDHQNKSLGNQIKLIKSDYSFLKNSMSVPEIDDFLGEIIKGQLSFFPKHGTYNMILSNEGLGIFKSDELNSKLIELYDYQYGRYEDIDAIVDQKFKFGLLPFLHRELGFFSTRDAVIDTVNPDLLEKNYSELVFQCQDLYGVTESGRNLLIDIQQSVDGLILMIRSDLEN